MRQVCLALSEAHGRGMIHRDLKPDNIFLNRSGEEEDIVKVLDFGVAKLMEPKFGSEDLTQAGTIFGTPRYMSPEQARGLKLDARADIYALGIIMYEAVAGVPPFDGNDTISILIKHCNEPVPPLPESVESLQNMPGLEALIRRCLAKTPEERPATVRDLRQELEQLGESWRGSAATGAAPIPPAEPSRANLSLEATEASSVGTERPKTKIKVGIAAVAILAAVGGMFAISRQGPTAPSTLPAADAVNAVAAPLGSGPTQVEQAPTPSAAAAAPSAEPAATPPAAAAVEQAGAGLVATKTEAAASGSKNRAPIKAATAAQATARPEPAVAPLPKPAPQEPPAQVAAIEPPKVAPPAPAPAAPSAAGPMVLPAGASEPDCVTGQTQPAFPSRARDAGVEGEVSVKIAVNADGTVSLVKILKSDPFFDDAVKSHLKTLRCRPARLNGSAISVFKNLRFPFRRAN
jgi:serine/threonine-protein kinase